MRRQWERDINLYVKWAMYCSRHGQWSLLAEKRVMMVARYGEAAMQGL